MNDDFGGRDEDPSHLSGVTNASIPTRWSTSRQAHRRVQRVVHPDRRRRRFPGGPFHVYDFIAGKHAPQMCGLGWKQLGVLELTALPSIRRGDLGPTGPGSRRSPRLGRQSAVPLLLDAGVRLADLLPSLRPEMVYVGTSGGAMVATPDFGGTGYDDSDPLTGSDEALRLVDFSAVFRISRARSSPTSPPARRDRTVGGGAIGAGVCDRRSDRDQGGRRDRRGHQRGPLEAVHP